MDEGGQSGAIPGAGTSARTTTARGEGTKIELSKRELAVARRLAESKATIPHLYVTTEILAPARGAAEIVSAAGRALADHGALNAGYRDGAVERHERVNVAVTLETDEGALMPTVLDADGKDVTELANEIERFADEARAGSLASPAMAGATFGVTVVDARSTLLPVITGGHAGHLAASISASGTRLGLAADARAVRPGEAAAFLDRVAELIGADPSSED